MIFDCGAGSGDSIIRLSALSDCFFLGIEFDKMLYSSSIRILKTITTNARKDGKDPQITGMFFHGDIVSLHFLGVTFLVAQHSHSHTCPVNTNNLLLFGFQYQLSTFSPRTFVYMFDACMDADLVRHLSYLWNHSPTTRGLATNASPHQLETFGSPKFRLVGQVHLQIKGSSENYTTYVYARMFPLYANGHQMPDRLFRPMKFVQE